MVLKYKGYSISIEKQRDTVSPHDFGGPELFLVCSHDLIDIPPKYTAIDGIIRRMTETHHVFDCRLRWEVGLPTFSLKDNVDTNTPEQEGLENGLVFVARTIAADKYNARLHAKGLIKTWNDYINGNVYECTITDDMGRQVSRQGGYYEDTDEHTEMNCYAGAVDIINEDLQGRTTRRLVVQSV
jgi:hypothetical protein